MWDNIFDRLMQRRAEPTYYGRVLLDQVQEKGFTERDFEPENSYLTLRLASMHLKNSGELWRNFLPFSVVVADLLYDGERTTFPFVVGNELVQRVVDVSLNKRSIEPLNTNVAGPLPYLGGEIGIFTGLFRATVNDMSKGLFDTVGDLAKLGDPGQLSSFLGIAEVLRNGVYRIFNMNDVEFCFGKRDSLDPKSNAGNRLKSGYLAFVNCPTSRFNGGDLWVENALLKMKRDPNEDAEFLGDQDYCLLAIDHGDTRGHYADLPCESIWKEMQTIIWNDQVEKAELFQFPELGKAIVRSPDLTPDDKSHALALYKLKMEKEIERYMKTKPGRSGKLPTRGVRGLRGGGAGKGSGMGAIPMMQKAAYVAGEATSHNAASLLENLANSSADVPHLESDSREGPVEIDDKSLDAQIVAVRKLRSESAPKAADLFEGLMADVLDTYAR